MTSPLSVITYLWHDPSWQNRIHYQYTPEDVYRLRNAVDRNLTVPHDFAVVTDRPELFDADSGVRAIPLDMTTHVPRTCFCRLFTFSPQAKELIGPRLFQMDLDTLVVGNLDPIVDRPEDLVLWRNPTWAPDRAGRPWYNGSFVLHSPGTAVGLWKRFPLGGGRYRDDQWWISEYVGPNVASWGDADGVYRLARDDTPGSGVAGTLPANARLVTFPGSEGKWWEPKVRAANPWIDDLVAA
jgi:hypothetical protein